MAAPIIDEVEFPQQIAAGAAGGPMYKTDIVMSSGGSEMRNQVWSAPLYRYNVATGLKSQADLQALVAFYRLRKGRARGFRFRDWTDYQSGAPGQVPVTPAAPSGSVNGAAFLGQSNGSQLVWQLVKYYQDALTGENRTIYKPVNDSTFAIYLSTDGITLSKQATGWTCDYTTGLVTFSVAPSSGVYIYATFNFDVAVRFDTDVMQAMQNEATGRWDNIILVELRN